MRVVIVSMFRNAGNYIPRYFDQMGKLQDLLSKRGISLGLILGYGDSTDRTADMLHEECLSRFDALLVDVSHGGPDFGSVVHPVRFRQLAGAINRLWQCIPKSADYVMVVESDLIWSAHTLESLLNNVE